MARPKKSPQDLRTKKFAIPLTAEEMSRIERAARVASGSAYTTWARVVLLRAADDVLRSAKSQSAVEHRD